MDIKEFTIMLFQYISCYGLSYIDSAPGNGFKFQYISCYGLSAYPVAQVLSSGHFNTSHVTVYQQSNWFPLVSLKFQYISCYGLSPIIIKPLFYRFNFNTSHVTVYRKKPRRIQNKVSYFNTSHVTVYLMR